MKNILKTLWQGSLTVRRLLALPAVSYAAAVASHPQTFLQVWRKTRGSNAPTAVRADALFVFPLVVHLAEHIQSWLVHNFWPLETTLIT